MPYSINIFDTKNLNAATVFEYAQRGTLNLKYNGGVDKRLKIIGSDLSFTMEVTQFQDGYFEHLYTGDERRYWVTMNDADTSAIIWQGFLLPEQYDEPYKSGAFFVKFIASCGLGSLKYQYLPDDYYKDEKTLIDVVAQCLQLTGIYANINVAPALSNITGAHWGEMYINTGKFYKKKKKTDAYKILNQIMNDTLCCVFQDSGQWFIYGYNKRVLLNIDYTVFNNAGLYLETKSVSKSPKNNYFLGVPRIFVNSPRRVIEAKHDLKNAQVDKLTYNYKNPGFWVANHIDVTNWKWLFSNQTFRAEYNTKDGKTFFDLRTTYSPVYYVELRKELLILAGESGQWDLELKSVYFPTGTENYQDLIEGIVNSGQWDKIFVYDIFYKDPATGLETILFSNINGANPNDIRYQVPFDIDRNAKLQIQFEAPETAYYNIRIYQPYGLTGTIKTSRIYLESFELTIFSADDEKIYSNNIDELYTQGIEIDLELHDDLKDYDNVFRLSKLGTSTVEYYNEVANNVLTIEIDGKHYLRVPVPLGLFIYEQPDHLKVSGDNIKVLDIIFNQPTEIDVLVQYDHELLGRVITTASEPLVVSARKFEDIPENINQWVDWTDDIYKTNYERYGDAVCKVLRNLYLTPHPRIQSLINGFMFFRDLINFDYKGSKVFYPTSLEILLDRNQTALVLSQNMYSQAVTAPPGNSGNLPPQVNAGPDLELTEGVNGVSISATASDPDGTIELVQWVLVSGSGSPNIVNPNDLNVNINNLTADEYVFRVTVTDNSGLTASDTVTITRTRSFEISVPRIFGNDSDVSPGRDNPQFRWDQTVWEWREILFNPPLQGNERMKVTVNGLITLETPINIGGAKPQAVWGVDRGTPGSNILTGVAVYFNDGPHNAVFTMAAGDRFIVRQTAKVHNVAKDGLYPEIANKVYSKVESVVTAVPDGPFGSVTNGPIEFFIEARR